MFSEIYKHLMLKIISLVRVSLRVTVVTINIVILVDYAFAVSVCPVQACAVHSREAVKLSYIPDFGHSSSATTGICQY